MTIKVFEKNQAFELLSEGESTLGTIVDFSDEHQARQFLNKLLMEPAFAQQLLRLVRESGGQERVPGHLIRERLVNDLVRGKIKVALMEKLPATTIHVPKVPEAITPEVLQPVKSLVNKKPKEAAAPAPEKALIEKDPPKEWVKIQVIDDATETPIPGVQIALALSNPGPIGTFTTDASGMIEVKDLDPGKQVTISAPDAKATLGKTLKVVADPAGNSYSELTIEEDQEAPSSDNVVRRKIYQGTYLLADVVEHKVATGEDLGAVASKYGLSAQELATFNWGSAVPAEVDNNLQIMVGSATRNESGQLVFDDADDPGIVYVPQPWKNEALTTGQEHLIRVKSVGMTPLVLQNEQQQYIPEAEFEATFSDGSKRTGKLGRTGAKVFANVPAGPIKVVYLDPDDVAAKSLAHTLRQALERRKLDDVYRVLKHSPEMLKRVKAAYEEYFNDLSGGGMAQDLEDQFGKLITRQHEPVIVGLMARAGLPTSAGATYVKWDEKGGDYELKASPPLRSITPGGEITFLCAPRKAMLLAADHEGPEVSWYCLNDRESIKHYGAQHVVFGPAEIQWETKGWQYKGEHTILCRVEEFGKITYYEQHVGIEDLEAVLDAEIKKIKDKDLPDPATDLSAMSRYADLLVKAKDYGEKELGQQLDEKQLKAFDARVHHINEYCDHLQQRLESTKGKFRFPFKAVHLSLESQETTALRVFLARLSSYGERERWAIVDWTNPAVRQLTGEYVGEGDTPKEAIEEALATWGGERIFRNGNRHCPGWIRYEIPERALGELIEGKIEAKGATHWDTLSSYLTWGGMVMGIAGIITAILPVPGSRVVSGMIWTSLLSSSGAAMINIGQRMDEGFSNWKEDTFDALTIAGGVFMGGWLRTAKVMAKVPNSKWANFWLKGDIGVTATEGLLLVQDEVPNFLNIMDDKALEPHERVKRLMVFFGRVSAQAGMYYVSYRGTKADLQHVKAAKADMPPAKELEVLAGREAAEAELTLDTTTPIEVEAQPKGIKNETAVQEEQLKSRVAPEPSARPKREVPADMRLDQSLLAKIKNAVFLPTKEKALLMALDGDRRITVSFDGTHQMTVREAIEKYSKYFDDMYDGGKFKIVEITPRVSLVENLLDAKMQKTIQDKIDEDLFAGMTYKDYNDAGELVDVTVDVSKTPVEGTVRFASGEIGYFRGTKDMWLDLAAEPDVVSLSKVMPPGWTGASYTVSAKHRTAGFDAYENWRRKLPASSVVKSTDTDIAGMTIYHGTVKSQEANVRQGPKNVGKGFGGSGLYVAVQGERRVAENFSQIAVENYSAAKGKKLPWAPAHAGEADYTPIVLTGKVTERPLRVGRFEVSREGRLNLEKGVIPADWADHPMLKDVLESEFDVLEVRNHDGLDFQTGSRFLIFHESAGADAIKWGGKELEIDEVLKVTRSSEGAVSGVYFVETTNSTYVLKPSPVPGGEAFALKLAKEAGIETPEVQLKKVQQDGASQSDLAKLSDKPPDGGQLASHADDHVLVLSKVEGKALHEVSLTEAKELFEGAQGEARLKELGRIYTFDKVTKNTDRFPTGGAAGGNTGNLMYSPGSGRFVAIDQEIGTIVANGETYSELESFLGSVGASKGVPSTYCENVRGYIESGTGYRLNEQQMLQVEEGMKDGIARLAKIDEGELEAIKEGLDQSAAGLRHIDTEWLGELFDLVRKRQAILSGQP